MFLLVLPCIGFSQASWDPAGNIVAVGKNYLGTVNNYGVFFISNNIERMRLTETGLFGIGTTNPQQLLHVNGNIRFSALSNSTQTSAIMIDANGDLSTRVLNIANWDAAYSWGNHAGLYRPISWVPSWNDVTGKPSFATVATSGNYNDLLNLPSLFDGNYNSLSNLPTLFDGNYSSLSNLPTLFDGNYASLAGSPTFATVAYTGSYYDLIDIPTLFNGDYYSLNSLPELFDGNYNSLSDAPTTESLNYWSKLNSNLFYSTGKVGVGTDNPQKQIHIHNNENTPTSGGGGPIDFEPRTRAGQIPSGRTSSESALLLTNKTSGSTATDGLLLRSYDNNAVIFLQETGSLSLITKNALRFKMESNGNVAIGSFQNNYFVVKESGKVGIKTTEPTAAFDINGDIRIRTGASENSILTSTANGTGQWKELKLELNGNTLSLANHNTAVDLSGFRQSLSCDGTYLTLSGDGGSVPVNSFSYWTKEGNKLSTNLGIGVGTTTPDNASKIHIKGNSKALLFEPVITGGSGYSDISFYDPTSSQESWTIRSHVNDQEKGDALMFWSRQGAPMILVGTDVKFGIGVETPSATLHIKKNTAQSENYSKAFQIDVNNNLTKSFVVYNSVNSEEVFRIWGNGSVNAKGIYAQQFKVKAQFGDYYWPDYVFNDDYDLMELSQLKSFIKENQHLPNVPSKDEVAIEGVDLGEMTTVLLQKIEELTLYIIKQDEQIKELKNEMNILKEDQNITKVV